MKISQKRIKEIIIEEYSKMFESSLDWEKNFKGFNKKELSAIENLVMMSAGGISDVLKDYRKNKSAFKAFIKDMVKGGMFEGQVEEGGKGSGRKPDDHTGGPSYANVPKGAKTSKQARKMQKDKKKKNVKEDSRYKLSTHGELSIHSGGNIAQVFGKNAVVALDKKSMKELVKLIRMNMGLFEKLEIMMEGKSFRLSNGVKVEFLGKMKLQLTNYKGKKVVLDVGELRVFLRGAKKGMGARA